MALPNRSGGVQCRRISCIWRSLGTGPRPELTFTSFGRHGGTTEASTSGLTETQLTQKGQWSSTAAMAHYLHDDDEAKQDAQMKRIKRRAKLAKQATVK